MKTLILALSALSFVATAAMAEESGTIKTGPYQTCSVTHTCPKDPPMRPHKPTLPPVKQ